jgi:hypothetical protein
MSVREKFYIYYYFVNLTNKILISVYGIMCVGFTLKAMIRVRLLSVGP